jgi:hypothetical protein
LLPPPPPGSPIHVICVERFAEDWARLVEQLEPSLDAATRSSLAALPASNESQKAGRNSMPQKARVAISAASADFVRDVLFPEDTALWRKHCNPTGSSDALAKRGELAAKTVLKPCVNK